MMVVASTPDASYRRGTWVAIAGQHTWLLADIDPTSPLVTQCWTIIRSGGTANDVLAALVHEGFRSAESFAIADFADGTGQLLLRGLASATMTSSGDVMFEVDGDQAATWVTRQLDSNVDSIFLTTSQGSDDLLLLPLSSGVTMAGHVSIVINPESIEVAQPQPELILAPPPQPPAPPPTLAPISLPTVEPETKTELVPELYKTVAEIAPPAEAPVEVEAPVEPLPPVEVSCAPSFDHLFGATQRPPAAAPPEAPTPVTAPESESESAAGVHTLMPNDTFYPRASGEASDIEASLIQALPWDLPKLEPADIVSLPPTPQPPPSSPPETPPAVPEAVESTPLPAQPPDQAADGVEESFEATINRAALFAAEPEVLYNGPTVLAALCPTGHISPAYAGVCRICQVALPPQDAFTAPRPVLGALHLSTGDVVTLDRGVILGRAPAAPIGNDPERPHVVQLASPENDISRTHVEVRLEGWHVLVTDLDSTNGTVVTLPGQSPQRLRANDPIAIEPGTVVTLADEVTFTYQVPA